MAETTRAAPAAASALDPALITKAEAFTRERFVLDGEDPADVLTPGSARLRALQYALREIGEGRKAPTAKWRRRWSLLLGLERVLNDDEPKLVDGTLLHPHQVDALSGTLTALLAAAQGEATVVPSGEMVLAVDETKLYAPVEERPEAPPKAEEPVEADDDDEDDDELGLDDELRAELAADDEEDEPEEDHEDEAESFEDDTPSDDVDEDWDEGAADDPNAHKRFWFEHATGAGKTVAAMAFVEASRTGGVLILTHRRNLVDQFLGELHDRGYAKRESPPLLDGEGVDRLDGPVTVETYQWFVRNAGRISDAYTIVICDEAHTALGDKTSAAIRAWTGPIFIGMTATGALIARHVTDLFPTQTSRFDLAQAARRGVIAPLRSIRIPPGPGVRTIAKVPLRRGDVDVEFDQELLAELLDQLPFNLAIADLYKTRFKGVPGVVYAAGVRHAHNVADAFVEAGIKARAVSGETKKRELAEILAAYERGDVDVLVNAQLLAEGWNSPRATVCMHLAPTASRRIYQQRVGRVTRRHPGKEAGVVVDFVHPATKNDDPVITLHSLLDRDVYRGGAIVVGPVRRGRGRRVRVERRVIPVCAEEERRHEVFERELWRVAVEFLDWGEQHMWAALAGARVSPSGWRRARAMLHFDTSGELKRRFLVTAVERNKSSQLRLRALGEVAALKDPEAFTAAVDLVSIWSRDERREGVKVLLQALAEKRIGRRDQAAQWIWDLADMTRDVHEEYAVQRWPETKRLLGLLVNSSGGAHARNARRLVHATRKQDRRLSAAILAAAVAHTPEAMDVVRGARTRLARKPSSLSRELLRNFPKGRGRRGRRRGGKKGESQVEAAVATAVESADVAVEGAQKAQPAPGEGMSKSSRRRRARRRRAEEAAAAATPDAGAAPPPTPGEPAPDEPAPKAAAPGPEAAEAVAAAASLLAPAKPKRASRARKPAEPVAAEGQAEAVVEEKPKPKRASRAKKPAEPAAAAETDAAAVEEKPKPKRASRARKPAEPVAAEGQAEAVVEEKPKPKRASRAKKPAEPAAAAETDAAAVEEKPKPKRASRAKKPAEPAAAAETDAAAAEEKPKAKRASRAKKADPDAEAA